MLLVGLLVVSNVNAQVLKVWKNDSASNFNVSTQVDSIAFASDSLKLFGVGSDVSYSVSGDLDSVTFAEGVHYGSMTDERDGKVYKTVKIGNQTWMAENLNYGEYLADDLTDSLFQEGAQKFCYGNYEVACDTLGGLYQWHTAMALKRNCGTGRETCRGEVEIGKHQGICPVGWHIPKQEEWEVLKFKIWNAGSPGVKLKLLVFGGDNSSGFSGIASGMRKEVGGFSRKNFELDLWSADGSGSPFGGFYYLSVENERFVSFLVDERYGLSVRCLKN